MTTIKLTKTEEKVLRLAARSYQGAVSTVQAEGVISRDLQAIRSLRAKGLMVSQGNVYTEWLSLQGRTTLYLTTHDAITDEGRQALEALS